MIVPQTVWAQSLDVLPEPGVLVPPSEEHTPLLLKGLTVYPDRPFQLSFIVDSGQEHLTSQQTRESTQQMMEYFLAALTLPKKDIWVNLSPFEEERILPTALGRTRLGQDLLAQDYILKQLTASYMDPNQELGAAFWYQVYQKVDAQYDGVSIDVNAFSKVWIIPERAEIYERNHTVYITQSRLKVLLERDYYALAQQGGSVPEVVEGENAIRDLILPEIEREVNEGAHFAKLRQIYHALILAEWYKQTVRGSALTQSFVDASMVAGIDTGEMNFTDRLYQQYVSAYRKGVVDTIKEEYDATAQSLVPRKYFSGGVSVNNLRPVVGEADQPKIDRYGAVHVVDVALVQEALFKDYLSRSEREDPARLDRERDQGHRERKFNRVYGTYQERYDRIWSGGIPRKRLRKKHGHMITPELRDYMSSAVDMLLGSMSLVALTNRAYDAVAKKVSRYFVERQISEDVERETKERIQTTLNDPLQTVEESRRVRHSYFKPGGYNEIDIRMSMFEALPYTEKGMSRSREANQREILIFDIGKELNNIIKRQHNVWNRKDAEIYGYLIQRMDDPDPRVAIAAIKSINNLGEFLTPDQSTRHRAIRHNIVTKYYQLISDQERSELVRGAAAQGLSFIKRIESIDYILEALQSEPSSWVKIYLLDSLGYLIKEYRGGITPTLYRRYDELVETLFTFIDRQQGVRFEHVSLKQYALEALGFLEAVDMDVIRRLDDVIHHSRSLTVQDAAVWAWIRLFLSSHSFNEHADEFLLDLVRFLQEDFGVNENPYLKDMVYDVLVQFKRRADNPQLRTAFKQLRRRKKRQNGNSEDVKPILFIDIQALVDQKGNVRRKNFELESVNQLLKHFRQSGHIVVPTQAFRQARDSMTIEDRANYKINLNFDWIDHALTRLRVGRPTMVLGRDNIRGAAYQGQEHIYITSGNKPVIVVGLEGEAGDIERHTQMGFAANLKVRTHFPEVLNDQPDYTRMDAAVGRYVAQNNSGDDQAVLAESTDVGGIDLQAVKLDRSSDRIIQFDPHPLMDQSVYSLSPQILQSVPVPNFMSLPGLLD